MGTPLKPSKRQPAHVRDKMVAEALRGVGRPVSAYELIEALRGKAILAPQTVYRSLDRLIADGQAHRLESLNAFVACRHSCHEGTAVFAICEDCGSVTEFDEATAVERLSGWAKKSKFAVHQMTLELRGQCHDCATSANRRAS